DSMHQAHPPHVADERETLLELLQRVAELLAALGGALGVFSRCMTSTVTSTAAIEIGLPPNVESERPVNAFATCSVAMVAPTGNPLAMDFANVMISGSTPQCSMPHQ